MSNYNSAEEDPMNGCGTGCLILALPYIIIGILMFIYFAIKHNILWMKKIKLLIIIGVPIVFILLILIELLIKLSIYLKFMNL